MGRLHKLSGVAVLCAVVWVGGFRIAQAEELSVGIVVGTYVNLTDQEADDIAAGLGRVLAEKLVVETRAGAEVRNHVGELPDDCTEKAACLQEIAKKLGVQQLLVLTVVRLGEKRQLSVTWADVTTGSTETRSPVMIQSGESLDTVFAGAANLLLPGVEERKIEVVDDPDMGGGGDTAGGGGETGTVVGPPGGGTIDGGGSGGGSGAGPVDSGGGRKIPLVTWILGGAAIPSFVVWGIFAAKAPGAESEAERCDEDCDDLKDKSQRINLIADISGFGGLGLAGGAVITYFLLRDSDSERAVSVTPTDSGAVVTFGGRF